jgi:hypothetical protein
LSTISLHQLVQPEKNGMVARMERDVEGVERLLRLDVPRNPRRG